jgi:homoserine O-acetyltransferase
VSRNRSFAIPNTGHYPAPIDQLRAALAEIKQPTLILGIQSDGLFTFAEQEELAASIPNSVLKTIDSSDGHDAFLLEFEQVNSHLVNFMKEVLPDIMQKEPNQAAGKAEVDVARKKTLISEADVDDITAW